MHEVVLYMIKFYIHLFIYLLIFIISPSNVMAKSIQVTNIHSKDSKEQICSICHTFQEALKQGTSDICIACHIETITIMGDKTLATHVLPMNRHIINESLPLGKYSYKIIQEDGHVYVEYLNKRLPLFGNTYETATIECATCHEPHGESYVPKMLRVDNSRGQLCEICHAPTELTLNSFYNNIYSQIVNFNDVHIWPESKCNICHLSSNPKAESSSLVDVDQSRLCESCHKETVTIDFLPKLVSKVEPMKNHPIKFSPLDFDPEKINHTIIKEGTYFYVSGEKAKIPLFGKSKESAVAECATCHEPHGESYVPKMLRVDNSQGMLCLICHKLKPK